MYIGYKNIRSYSSSTLYYWFSKIRTHWIVDKNLVLVRVFDDLQPIIKYQKRYLQYLQSLTNVAVFGEVLTNVIPIIIRLR